MVIVLGEPTSTFFVAGVAALFLNFKLGALVFNSGIYLVLGSCWSSSSVNYMSLFAE